MHICDYGCGRPGQFTMKNGKHCCSEAYRGCPAYQEKFRAACSNNDFRVRGGCRKKACRHCNEMIGTTTHARHELACYMNPDNLRLCAVCGKPIKNLKQTTVCSKGCANTYFRSGENNPNYKETPLNYTVICFRHHDHKCVICGEENIVAVHHFDENHDNNDPTNLIPLCPTHHQYWHSRFKDQVYDEIVRYKKCFEERFSGAQSS